MTKTGLYITNKIGYYETGFEMTKQVQKLETNWFRYSKTYILCIKKKVSLRYYKTVSGRFYNIVRF